MDDEAQEIFGLPNRYIWDVYEPESDESMTLKRLTTLLKQNSTNAIKQQLVMKHIFN